MNFSRLPRWWSQLGGEHRTGHLHIRVWNRRTFLTYRAALGVVVVGFLTTLASHQRPYSIGDLPLGQTAPETVHAPFLFQVPKSDGELAEERHRAESTIPTHLRHDSEIERRQSAHLDSVFRTLLASIRLQVPDTLKQQHLQRQLPDVIGSLSVEALTTLVKVLSAASIPYAMDFQAACQQILGDLFAAGIIASKTPLSNDISDRVLIGEAELPVDVIHSEEELKQGAMVPIIAGYRLIDERGAVAAVHELLSLFIQPNLVIDGIITKRGRTEARRGVASIKRIYAEDDVIVQENEVVTAQHIESLDALAQRLAAQELQNPLTRLLQRAAAAVISAFLVILFGYYLATRETEVYNQPGPLLLLALLAIAVAVTGAYIKTNQLDIYLVPTALVAMLATILLNQQIGLVLSLLIALQVGTIFGDFYVALTCSLTSAVAVYSVRHVRHRNQFYRAMIFLPVSYALLIAAADVLRFVPPEEIYQHVLPGVFVGVAAPILTIGLLPIFESLFNRTTDITLLELSDLNRPLLRELAIRAPGTYTHSLIMANLSESAAEAIGANPLLARVASYYHDIGKMIKPEYFSENQGLRGGRNPHDHLTPNMSMLIIVSHVKDGLEMAAEHGLPKSISDLIPQHHGTTVIDYFYNRAVELGDENVRRDDFRYGGPKPQNKEAGILMLADSVESAVRTLNERTANRVKQLVSRIVQQKFTAGELNECELTLQDLHGIEESFIPVLMGTLHGRVEYPWQQTAKKARRDVPNPI
jgi:putative nucleotidyltransferase with HDIG domain